MGQGSDLEAERQALLSAIDAEASEAIALARWMYEHPELSLAEHATSERYVGFLDARGFGIERGVAGLPTAFVARHGPADAPLRVAGDDDRRHVVPGPVQL